MTFTAIRPFLGFSNGREQIEGRGLDQLLFLTSELSEAVGEGVGNAEVHGVSICRYRVHPASVFPVFARHDPFHELVKQRHRKCGVAMARTPDHALDDQLTPGRAERSDIAA